MPYAILRFAKKKTGGVTAAYSHNERQKQSYKSNPNIDPEKRNQNYHLIEPKQPYRKEVQCRIAAAGCRTRKDSTVMVETLITASPEFMIALPPAEQREYFEKALDFMAGKISKDNIISAVVHMDEKTPHMHLSFCPITKDNRLSAKALLGNQADLSKWQTEYHRHMSARWSVLERGESAMVTKRKHIPTWMFKQAEKLDKQFSEVNAALADISAFNAGKKRDKALSLLAAWLPEAERFTAQVKKVNEYVRGLEGLVMRKDATIRQWKSKSSEEEEKAYLANVEVYRLKERIEQQQRILARIPPEVLKQLKDKQPRGLGR